MRKHLVFGVGLVLLSLVVAGGLWIPIAPQNVAMVALPVSRMVACPVPNDSVGSTTVMLADQEPFTTLDLLTGEKSSPTTGATIEEATSVIIARGSASLGGYSRYVGPSGEMAAPCAPAITWGAWNGVNTEVGSPVFLLTNVDEVSAVVDVHIFGETGPITRPGLSDMSVSPGELVVINLKTYEITSETPITVVIRATKGRVSAMLRVEGDQGSHWQLPQTAADTDLIIAGIPAGFSERLLSITNTDPTQRAVVSLSILGENGTFEPLVGDSFEVGPARTKTIDITQWLGGQASGLHLVSDLPITATMVLAGAGFSGISPQPALGGELVFPPVEGTLWLANPSDEAVSIFIKAETEDSAEASELEIPAGYVRSIPFPGEGISVLMVTTSMALRASLHLGGDSLSILPLWGGGAAFSVSVPALDPGLG